MVLKAVTLQQAILTTTEAHLSYWGSSVKSLQCFVNDRNEYYKDMCFLKQYVIADISSVFTLTVNDE